MQSHTIPSVQSESPSLAPESPPMVTDESSVPIVSKRRPSYRWMWLVTAGGLIGAGLVGGVVAVTHPRNQDLTVRASGFWEDEGEEGWMADTAPSVRTIRPKRNPHFVRSIKEPAFVEEYLKADLYANVSGTVKYIEKNIGDLVTAGEVLVELDVPDRVQEVAQKEALVRQARADAIAAQAEVLVLEEAVHTARALVEEKRSEVERLQAVYELRKAELRRITELAKRDAVSPALVDEKLKDTRAAEAACKAAEVAVKRAQSDVRMVEARVSAALADLEVKQARIDVAQQEKLRVQALADFGKIRAPFNGVIVKRYVDPGAFVQNASTARTTPLLSLRGVDRVTIYMMVPERSAPFVSTDTQAVIQLDSLPDQLITAQVTRISDFLDPERGRAMRVEVDLYNPPDPNYQRSVGRGVTSFLMPLAATTPVDAAILTAEGRSVWGRKGRLQPGMYGTMRLILQKFENAYLVPCGAYFSQRGSTFILKVVDGKAQLVPVRVQYEDGVQAKIAVIARPARPALGEEEVLQDLNGDEEIIITNHGEIRDGQEVAPTLVDW